LEALGAAVDPGSLATTRLLGDDDGNGLLDRSVVVPGLTPSGAAIAVQPSTSA
jgi:hypothetical protein